MRRIETLGDLLSPLGNTINSANVVMQLSLAGVGHGVVDSTVDTGRADLHPVKRARTTTTYLAVALYGTQADRDYVHESVRAIHARVVSAPNAPVAYSANSPKLQLWVAVCLFKYFVDQYEFLYGPLTDDEFERALRAGVTLGSTLNVRPEQWPSTRLQYDEQWKVGLDAISMTDEVRGYLRDLCDLGFLQVRLGLLGRVVHTVLGRRFELVTRGALPPEFRTLMHYSWTDRDQRAFDAYLRRMRILHRWTRPLWPLPWKAHLLDMRIRRRLGRPVF
ncbi:oxygenase MpaB family protein [Rhodococcus triatomae]|nr:hypothetical protein G419_20330 [Rhodococcus triatomae BKS 15-14]